MSFESGGGSAISGAAANNSMDISSAAVPRDSSSQEPRYSGSSLESPEQAGSMNRENFSVLDKSTDSANINIDLSTQAILDRGALDNGNHPDRLLKQVVGNRRTINDSPIFGRNSSNRLYNNIPMTNFLASQGQKKIIIIKPTGDNVHNFINNPVEIVKSVRQSPFSAEEIVDVKVNKRRNILVAELKEYNQKMIEKLTAVTKLGAWEVECSQPNSDIIYYGVVSPVSVTTDKDEFKKLIDTHSDQSKVIKVERLFHKVQGQWVESDALKLAFTGTEKVDHITVGRSYYKVRPFVANPIRCFRCQKLGHTSLGCNAKEKCLICSKEHNRKDCNATPEQYKCANCRGNHVANSKQCPLIKKAFKIEKIKTTENKSYTEARDLVLTNSRRQQTKTSSSQEYRHDGNNFPRMKDQMTVNKNHMNGTKVGTAYADVVTGRGGNKQTGGVCKECGSKTKPPTEKEVISKTIIDALSMCLVEVLSKLGLADAINGQAEIISQSLEKHLGNYQNQQDISSSQARKRQASDTTSSDSWDDDEEEGVISDQCVGGSNSTCTARGTVTGATGDIDTNTSSIPGTLDTFITVEKRQVRRSKRHKKTKENKEIKENKGVKEKNLPQRKVKKSK